MGKVVIALLFSLIAVNLASAGVLRNVVRPVVRASGHAVVHVAKAIKTVAY